MNGNFNERAYQKQIDVLKSELSDTQESVKDVYSTNEVKTNKVWIDGKPIYRKVFREQVSGKATMTGSNIANIKDFVYIYGTMDSLGNEILPTEHFTDDVKDFFRVFYSKGTGVQYIIGTNFKTCIITVIVEYTKTTD